MGFISTILGFCGFGVGISAGLAIGYFLFIYFQPNDVKVFLYSSVSLYPSSNFTMLLTANLA
jgi:hypothetical protein